MIRLALVGLLIVAGATVATEGGSKPCGNPPGVPGTVTTTDTFHGWFVTEDSPNWARLCGTK